MLMRRTGLRVKFVIGLFLIVAEVSFAQTTQTIVGTPQFGSFTGGPDVIDLGNLNIHFGIPVRHKPGRGTNFDYDLTYDSSVWSYVSSNGHAAWQPVSSLSLPGWGGLANTGSSYIGYSQTTSSGQCYDGSQWAYYYTYGYGPFYYSDEVGTRHYFSAGWAYIQNNGPGRCGPSTGYQPNGNTQNAGAGDGSGYTLTVTPVCCGNPAIPYVDDKHGTKINAPVLSNPTPQTSIDRNGNEISVTSGTWTDTLGQGALVVSGVAPSNTTLTYSPPAGGSASYVVKYQQFTVQTKFQCANVSDYGPTASVNLVTEIDLPDISVNSGSKYTFQYETTPNDTHTPHYVTARIQQITLPTGGTITYNYTGANDGMNCTDGSTIGFTRQLSTDANPWQYSRSNSSGYWQTTVLDPSSNKTVVNFTTDTFTYNNNSTTQTTYYETQRQVYQGSSTLLATSVRCYNGVYSNCAALSSLQGAAITQTIDYHLPGSMSTAAVSQVSWDGYGVATDDKEYDYGNTINIAPSSTLLIRETVSPTQVFGGYDDAYTSIKVQDGATPPNVLANTTFTHDEGTPTAISGTPQHQSGIHSGNLTTIATQVNSTSSLYRHFAYYDTGMPKTTTDTKGAVTTYNYPDAISTCGNTFATSLNLPVIGTTPLTTYNCAGAVATQIKDLNGNPTNISYSDPYFWRPASANDPLNNTANAAYAPTSIEAYLNFGTSSTTDVVTSVDALGRPIFSQQRQAQASSTFDSTQTTYGWTTTGSVTGPFTTASVPYAGTLAQNAPGGTATTKTQYDALGRTTSVTDGGSGTVSYSYTNQDVLQAVGPTQTFQKQFEYDGLGMLTSACEVTSATGHGTCSQSNSLSGYWTRYKYDAMGRLIGVCQNTSQPLSVDCVATPSSGQQTRTYSYDMLSRLTSETNPETGNTSPGTANYTYDAACGSYAASAGDLTKRVDNAGNTTCFAYDNLHRLTDAGNTGPTCRHFRYDSQTPPSGVTISNTLGRTAEAYTDNCSGTKKTDEWFSYDAAGNNTDFYEWTAHSSGYYHSQAGYWANGGVKSLTALNASGGSIFPTIYYGASDGSGLDGEGRITKVTASSGTNPVSSVTYATSNSTTALTGLLTGLSFPSGDSDSFTYDPNTGRQQTYTFSVNGATDKGTMTWNANGTLGTYAIADNLPSAVDTQTCNYFYDDLARLGGKNANGYSVDCGSKWQQLFTFDAFGNIKKSGSLAFQPTYTTATNHISGMTGVQYDSNGNLTQDNLGTQYTWDPNFGNPASINTTNLTYDAQGQMVEQQNGSTYTQMLYSQIGKTAIMNGQALQKSFVALPGGGTAIHNSAGTLAYYRHADWLGSSRLTTTTSRTVYSDSAYAPFGEEYDLSGTADASFTGQNSDTNSNLYDFVFREYSPSQGRWVSPDPAGSGSVNTSAPQSWNRYAYVMNNPMIATDPNGLDCVYDEDGGAFILTGDCASETDDGVYIDGSVTYASFSDDGNSLVYLEVGLNDFQFECLAGCGTNYFVNVTAVAEDVPLDTSFDHGIPNYLASAPNNFIRMPLPANAQACSTSTGVNFNAPPGFSVSNIAANGAANGLAGAGAAVGQGGYYDFQRFQVGATTYFYPGYTPVANIAVGAYVQGTGTPQWMAGVISNTYAFFKSSNGATALQAQFRNLGYSLAARKATYSCHPQIP